MVSILRQTVRHIRTTLRLALGDAVRDGLAGRNAAADAEPPFLPHRPITYLSARDVRRLIDGTADLGGRSSLAPRLNWAR